MSEDSQTVLSVIVDYSKSLRQMIDAGEYDEVSADINSRNFRLSMRGCRVIELALVQFKQPIAPLEAVVLMKERGYRPPLPSKNFWRLEAERLIFKDEFQSLRLAQPALSKIGDTCRVLAAVNLHARSVSW